MTLLLNLPVLSSGSENSLKSTPENPSIYAGFRGFRVFTSTQKVHSNLIFCPLKQVFLTFNIFEKTSTNTLFDETLLMLCPLNCMDKVRYNDDNLNNLRFTEKIVCISKKYKLIILVQ